MTSDAQEELQRYADALARFVTALGFTPQKAVNFVSLDGEPFHQAMALANVRLVIRDALAREFVGSSDRVPEGLSQPGFSHYAGSLRDLLAPIN